MNFYPIFWKEMMLIRKKPWRFLASSLVMPLLYLVTFGWGLGRGMNMGGGRYLEFVLPGILALSAMNNSFSPVSTSLNISKLYTKTLEEVLVSPVSPWDITLGRTLTGLVRGLFSALMLMLVGLASQACSCTSPSTFSSCWRSPPSASAPPASPLPCSPGPTRTWPTSTASSSSPCRSWQARSSRRTGCPNRSRA